MNFFVYSQDVTDLLILGIQFLAAGVAIFAGVGLGGLLARLVATRHLPTCGQILQKFAILYALFALLVLPLGLGGVIGFYAKAHTTFDLAVLLETVVTAGMSGLFLGLDRKLQERAKLVEAGLLGLLKYY